MTKLPNPFRQPTIQEVRTRAITDTELALHDAKMTAERAQATVQLLETTLKRLKAEQNANP